MFHRSHWDICRSSAIRYLPVKAVSTADEISFSRQRTACGVVQWSVRFRYMRLSTCMTEQTKARRARLCISHIWANHAFYTTPCPAGAPCLCMKEIIGWRTNSVRGGQPALLRCKCRQRIRAGRGRRHSSPSWTGFVSGYSPPISEYRRLTRSGSWPPSTLPRQSDHRGQPTLTASKRRRRQW